MIDKVIIQGYRIFDDFKITLCDNFNIFVGDNSSGKSTLLEAISLALTGYINSKPAQEELNPYWFNASNVKKFFKKKDRSVQDAPTINIEIYFKDKYIDILAELSGANNSDMRTCSGINFSVKPDVEYCKEFEEYLKIGVNILPVEYYAIEWVAFSGEKIFRKPKNVNIAIIDNRTLRTTSGLDYYIKNLLKDNISIQDRSSISAQYRLSKHNLTENHLKNIINNDNISSIDNDSELTLAMDQTSRSSWESIIAPHIKDTSHDKVVPFGFSGQGVQAATKILLAMNSKNDKSYIVMIEEPENHLSHSKLNVLLNKVSDLSVESNHQLLITTHSSFVLNSLGIDSLRLICNNKVVQLNKLSKSTIDYFKKLPGYDTLRTILSSKIVLVEGPSDELLFRRFYKDANDKEPIHDGIDVICVNGLSFKHFLDIIKQLDIKCACITDNDHLTDEQLQDKYKDYSTDKIKIYWGDDAGHTLEPQIIANNNLELLNEALGKNYTNKEDLLKWMLANKTESALRIFNYEFCIQPPKYIEDAINFISTKSCSNDDPFNI